MTAAWEVAVTDTTEVRAQAATGWTVYLVSGIWLTSLGLLLWAAVTPAPDSWLYVALGAFIGCSAAWTALQLSQARRARPVVILVVGLLLLVFCVAAVGCSLWGLPWPPHEHPSNQWIVGAWASAYLGFGFLVEWLREKVDRHARISRAGLWSFAGGLLVIVGIGIALLRGVVSGLAPVVAAIVVVLLVLPVSLNVLSEKALSVLHAGGAGSRPPAGRWQPVRAQLRKRWVWAVSGLVLAGGPVTFLTWRSHWHLTALVAAACLLVLLAALVSNTHADIAIVLCVIALLGLAPVEVNVALAQPVSAGKPAPRDDLLALGDSYMSGEGAKAFIKDTDEAGADACRRAPSAYAVLGVGPETPFGHVSFLACSGARTNNVLPELGMVHQCAQHETTPCAQTAETRTQVDQITALASTIPGGYKPKLAIVSLGGNDAGFAELGQACVAPGDCTRKQDVFFGNLRQVQTELVKTYEAIRAALPDTPVAVVPYPQPLADQASCGGIALTITERQFIRKFLVTLNQVIEWAANQVHFYYMASMENALAGQHLQLCDPRNPGGYGINFVSPESVGGLPDQRFNPAYWLHDSFHPNERGHQAMLDAFAAWLTQHPNPTTTAPADSLARQPALPASSCSFTSDASNDSSCSYVLKQWEYSQIVGLWPYSFCVLIGLLGLWMLSVAALSGRPLPSDELKRPGQRPEPEAGQRRYSSL